MDIIELSAMTSGKSFGKGTKSFGQSRKTLAHPCPLLPTIGKSFSPYCFGYLTETLALLPRRMVRDGGLAFSRPPRCGPGEGRGGNPPQVGAGFRTIGAKTLQGRPPAA
jgi:hypothetical protein